ncbi:MAG: glycine zipper domain-containing protein [Accumulibacter sp.]|uniref:glycine zipper domain-containing protein n=1 Tax=Accumulibacter sp. TaxID=2053492 RepID=UPI00331588F7
MDDRATGALIGAAAGCALASATGHSCLAGAAMGAAVGFMIGWYFESKKVASASQVNNEYKKKGQIIPKDEVKPAKFETVVKPGVPEKDGQREVQVTSNTDLIGYGDKAPEVTQKYAIYDENNKLVEEKSERVAAVDGSGRYETNSKFKLPASAKGKKYTVKTTLLADNKTYKETSYKVAFGDDGNLIVAMIN